MSLEHQPPSSNGFRAALSSFATSVNVVTVWDENHQPSGMTATAFSSVSMEPLLVLVCINRDARTYANIAAQQQFAVNILSSRATEISEYCSRPGADKGLDVAWLASQTRWKSPALAGALAVLDCEVDQDVTAGTHAVLIGRVVGIGLNRNYLDNQPLLHFRGAYHQLQAQNGYARPKSLPVVLEEFS